MAKPRKISARAPSPPPKPALRCPLPPVESPVSAGAAVAVAKAVERCVPEVLDVFRVVVGVELEEPWEEEDVEVVVVGEDVELVGSVATVAVLLKPETPIIVCAAPAGITNVPSPV